MINLLNTVKDTIKPFQHTITSIGSVLTGNLLSFDIYIQRIAYFIAILSGLVAVYNGTRGWHRKKRKQ